MYCTVYRICAFSFHAQSVQPSPSTGQSNSNSTRAHTLPENLAKLLLELATRHFSAPWLPLAGQHRRVS